MLVWPGVTDQYEDCCSPFRQQAFVSFEEHCARSDLPIGICCWCWCVGAVLQFVASTVLGVVRNLFSNRRRDDEFDDWVSLFWYFYCSYSWSCRVSDSEDRWWGNWLALQLIVNSSKQNIWGQHTGRDLRPYTTHGKRSSISDISIMCIWQLLYSYDVTAQSGSVVFSVELVLPCWWQLLDVVLWQRWSWCEIFIESTGLSQKQPCCVKACTLLDVLGGLARQHVVVSAATTLHCKGTARAI